MELCLICNSNFEKKVWNQKYCSISCRERSELKVKKCGNCNVEFTYRKKTAKYCSMMCASIGEKRRVLYRCVNCNKEFYEKKSKAVYGYAKCCSKKCADESFKQPYWFSCIHCGQISETLGLQNVVKRKFCNDQCKTDYFERGINDDEVIKLYVEEQHTAEKIGEIVGTNDKHVYKILKRNNIEMRNPGYGNRLTCKDGHVVKSHFEMVFDNRMTHHGIKHEYEPRISKDTRYFADFKVGDVYIEIWGLIGNKKYDERMHKKKKLYKEKGLTLLNVYPSDYADIDKKIFELKRLIS